MTTYERKAIERLPEGNFYADAAYDSRRVLNTVVDRGYLPIVKEKTKREVTEQEFGIFDKDKYRRRGIYEGLLALNNWFGDRIPCSLVETAVTRLLIRVACYALRILLRVCIIVK